MLDAIIIGGGPAGLSGALVLGRAMRKVLLVDAGPGRNAPAEGVHNLLSRDGISPSELRAAGRSDLAPYSDVEISDVGATKVAGRKDAFEVTFEDGRKEQARRLLLATGVEDVLPPVEGLAPLWGRSVLHCPYCHGYEVRDHPLAVLATSDFSTMLALRLRAGFSDDVVYCTNEEQQLDEGQIDLLEEAGVSIRTERIARLVAKDGALSSIEFAQGPRLERDALFLQPPLRQRSSLPEDLGCRLLDDNTVEVNDFQQTTVPGVFAAGDMARRAAMPFVREQVVTAAADALTAAVILDQELTF